MHFLRWRLPFKVATQVATATCKMIADQHLLRVAIAA